MKEISNDMIRQLKPYIFPTQLVWFYCTKFPLGALQNFIVSGLAKITSPWRTEKITHTKSGIVRTTK